MLRRLRSRRAPGPVPGPPSDRWPHPSVSEADRAIVEASLPHTMTGPDRLQALVDAVRHVVATDVPGSFVECGVWQGGSILAIIKTLQELGIDDRDVFLYDTFEGMTEPTEHDVSPVEPPALLAWSQAESSGERVFSGLFDPQIFHFEGVRRRVLATGYPEERIHFVQGRVEDTLLERVPDEISILRLDTDWYESTRVEMDVLYPRLARGGVLIIDDWGHWEGARRAVEEYFAEHPPMLFLGRIDYSARIGVKR